MDSPSVGRIVHYTSYGTPKGEFSSQCRAAVVTAVDGDVVSLAVINPTGLFFHGDAPLGEPGEGGSWHWPERV